MATGVFYVRKGNNGAVNGRRSRASDYGRQISARVERNKQTAREAAARRDIFAERLAEGDSVVAAARSLDLSPATGKNMLKRLCEDLGWQAV